MPMTDNTAAAVIVIELLAASQACHFHEPLMSSAPLWAIRISGPHGGHPHTAIAERIIATGHWLSAVRDGGTI